MLRITHVALFLSLSVPAAVLGAKTYTVTTLTYPGASETYAEGINNAGEVVGFYTDDAGTSHGFTWTAGKYTSFDIPGASGTWMTGINQGGTICGYFHTSNGVNGTTAGFTKLGSKVVTFSPTTSSRATFPGGINNAGEISGYYETGALSDGVFNGFLLTAASKGTTTTVLLPAAANTWIGGLDNSEDLVGFAGADLDPTTTVTAFEYVSATATFETATMPGMVQTRFYGINDAGAIVGYGLDSSELTHSFVYKSGTFNALAIPGYSVTIPQGINNSSAIVGYAVTPANAVVGFVATP